MYGNPALLPLAPPAPGCEVLELCGVSRFLCVAEPSTADKLDQTSADIESALNSALSAADSLIPVDNTSCGGCGVDEECFLYGAKPVADPSLCPEPCGEGTTCIQAKKSGSNQYQCLPTFTCNPQKSNKTFYPVAPLYACPESSQ